jgi:hypothetical protein
MLEHAQSRTVIQIYPERRSVRYTAELKELESCRDSFRQLKELAVSRYTFKKQYHMQKKSVTVL